MSRKGSFKSKNESNEEVIVMEEGYWFDFDDSTNDKKQKKSKSKSSTNSISSSKKRQRVTSESEVNVTAKKMRRKEKESQQKDLKKSKKKTDTKPLPTNNKENLYSNLSNEKDVTKSKSISKPRTGKRKENSSDKQQKKRKKKQSNLSPVPLTNDVSTGTNLINFVSNHFPDTSSISSTVQEIIEYKHAYEDPNWKGNEDEAGSVASGILEEDYCFECGKSTLDCLNTNNVILCDVCDGEFHLQCVGLDKLPRSTFVCLKCIEEQEQQQNLRFNVSDTFRIPRKRIVDRVVVYSPSRPLDAAWEECKQKGLMTVSSVFSYEVMKYLTHGVIENTTLSGRVVDVWRGATVEIANRLQSATCHNLVDREGRFDLKLPNYVVEFLKLDEILEPILSKLRTIMGTPTPQIRTHNVVFAPVGSMSQQWHTDDDFKERKLHRYFTILIQLNSIDSGCGGTEIWMDKLNRGDLIRCRPGDALVFHGSLLHRGQANLGYSHRFFYYASFACNVDMNVGDK